MSALKTFPGLAKYGESMLERVWAEKGFKTTILKYREVHDAEFILSVHEIVGLIGTNTVC